MRVLYPCRRQGPPAHELLLLVDTKERYAGAERCPFAINLWGWRRLGVAPVYHDGCLTEAVTGPVEFFEVLFHRPSGVVPGHTVQAFGLTWTIRPCPAAWIATRLEERWVAQTARARAVRIPTLAAVRRQVFSWRHNPPPNRVYFAKGTVSVEPPPGAVARVGDSEASTVVFLDHLARPLAAYRAAGDWYAPYAKPIPVPARLTPDDLADVHPLGRSVADRLFGVRGPAA